MPSNNGIQTDVASRRRWIFGVWWAAHHSDTGLYYGFARNDWSNSEIVKYFIYTASIGRLNTNSIVAGRACGRGCLKIWPWRVLPPIGPRHRPVSSRLAPTAECPCSCAVLTHAHSKHTVAKP